MSTPEVVVVSAPPVDAAADAALQTAAIQVGVSQAVDDAAQIAALASQMGDQSEVLRRIDEIGNRISSLQSDVQNLSISVASLADAADDAIEELAEVADEALDVAEAASDLAVTEIPPTVAVVEETPEPTERKKSRRYFL